MNLLRKRKAHGYIKVLLLFASIAMAATTLSAQDNNKVTLSRQELSIAEAFRDIEAQTNWIVAVNLGKFDVTKRVQLQKNPATIDEILRQLLAGTGHTYRISGNYLMIIPPERKGQVQETVVVQQPHDYTSREQKQVFENDVDAYTHQNLNQPRMTTQYVTQYETVMRYDTIRTNEAYAGGNFVYAPQSRQIQRTGRPMQQRTPYTLDTPPIIAVKTNLLYAATLTPNLGVEIGLSDKISLEISGGNNRWNLDGDDDDNKKLVHWLVKPEVRYWLCERFNGHFFGLHALYAKYNIGGHDIPLLNFDKEYRYEGDAFGGGISYGYHWMWNKRWGMEFNIGAGVLALDYKKYDCAKCGDNIGSYKKTYFGPTSAGIKLIFIIK